MTCPCHKKPIETAKTPETPVSSPQRRQRPTPLTQCLFCAQKHLETAMTAYHEHSYLLENLPFIRGNLRLAIGHTHINHPDLADKLRTLTHSLQHIDVTPETTELFRHLAEELQRRIAEENPRIAEQLLRIANEQAEIPRSSESTLSLTDTAGEHSHAR